MGSATKIVLDKPGEQAERLVIEQSENIIRANIFAKDLVKVQYLFKNDPATPQIFEELFFENQELFLNGLPTDKMAADSICSLGSYGVRPTDGILPNGRVVPAVMTRAQLYKSPIALETVFHNAQPYTVTGVMVGDDNNIAMFRRNNNLCNSAWINGEYFEDKTKDISFKGWQQFLNYKNLQDFMTPNQTPTSALGALKTSAVIF